MKTLPRITLFKDGLPAVEQRRTTSETGAEAVRTYPLTTSYLIKAALNGSQYETPKDQYTAFKVSDRLGDDDEEVTLEDAEFELIEKKCREYKPFLNGTYFAPFFQLFEEAKGS